MCQENINLLAHEYSKLHANLFIGLKQYLFLIRKHAQILHKAFLQITIHFSIKSNVYDKVVYV